MNERNNLEREELSQLNKENCLAMDLYRKEAKEKGEAPCCWLVMSDEAREEAMRNLLAYLSRETGRKVDRLALMGMSDGVPFDMLHQWQEAEAVYKRLREEGNPRAYFVEECS